MFRNLSFFGIPMAARWNRRALVVVTYFAALLLTATSVNRGWLLVSWGVATFWIVVPQVVFGWIVTPYFGMAPLIGPRPPERVLHGLMGRDVPAEEPDPDERDLAVRNSAFFRAY